MDQVFAYSMPPMHISPVALIRIMLIKQMILAFIINQTVRVVIPSPALSIMYLRTIRLFIKTILPGYFICLIDLIHTGGISAVRYFYLLPLERRYITKHPVIRLCRCQSDIKRTDRLSIYSQSHHSPFFLMRNRKIQIFLRNFQCKIFCVHTSRKSKRHN